MHRSLHSQVHISSAYVFGTQPGLEEAFDWCYDCMFSLLQGNLYNLVLNICFGGAMGGVCKHHTLHAGEYAMVCPIKGPVLEEVMDHGVSTEVTHSLP